MTPKLSDRLSRLETRPATQADTIPPGMVPVLMWSVATRLGGLARPSTSDGSTRTEDVSDGFARGLGYNDFAEMDRIAGEDPEAWGLRVEAAYTALLQTEDIVRGETNDAQVFAGLARILDDTGGAKAAYGATPGWTDMTERLNDWAMTCGLTPSTMRTATGYATFPKGEPG